MALGRASRAGSLAAAARQLAHHADHGVLSARTKAAEGSTRIAEYVRSLTCRASSEEGQVEGPGGNYMTLAERVRCETEVKRSRFIAWGAPVGSEAEALTFLDEVKDPSASHNCWAFKLGERYRFSDDGEPGGTAGRPMYAAIEGSGLDAIMVVVTRFFGGTKLGSGGLVRAYGGAVTACLRDAPTREVRAKVSVEVLVPYELLGILYSLLEAHGADKISEEFGSGDVGGVKMALRVEPGRVEKLTSDLKDASAGQVVVQRPP
ncbi:hypothetical protein KFL_007740050 [Klebsormidium nitens]|uniref:Impact N-terminal domain-containing protein n=1 Tax=Klebsormidium nitens TaxID=105231 RepID=A0A1Y1IML0_KLENI|nr:hypothetical protein KFL_007740050 [Klebsormidium nitens]|eukprot:GAQ91372.1 hypothetical protein KFL_007740050 [Klebsormidium nitens]